MFAFQIITKLEWIEWVCDVFVCELFLFFFWLLWVTAAAVKKKQLHVEKADDDLIVNTYDDVDDYDFM